MGRRGRDRMVV